MNNPNRSNICQKSAKPVDPTAPKLSREACSRGTLVFLVALATLLAATPNLSANQVVPGTVPPITAGLQPIGPLDPHQEMSLAILFPVRNQPSLDNLLQQLYDPASTNYCQYITPEQFRDNFGATGDDYQAVEAFAQANNLTVTYAHSNRLVLDVAGTVSDIETAFNVHMLVFQHPTENRTFYAPDADPTLNLNVAIQWIGGLDNYNIGRRNYSNTPLGEAGAGVREAGAGTGLGGSGEVSGIYWSSDLRAAYLPGVTSQGAGQIVALAEFGIYNISDITNYEYYGTYIGQHAITDVPLVDVLVDSGPDGYLDAEVSIDIEMAIAMAPELSEIIVYEGAGQDDVTTADSLDVLSRIADDNLAKQISMSLSGFSEADFEGVLQQMAAQGQSFFTSSGDTDAWASTYPPYPADSPYATAVGGTELGTSGPAGIWTNEVVWNFNNSVGCLSTANEGSSGGISTYFSIPTWQDPISMSSAHGSATMRNSPDVALVGDKIFNVFNGTNYCGCGTSYAAPLWAGLTAIVNAQAANDGLPSVGFLNPALYAIGTNSTKYARDFHDVTLGNNTNAFSPTNFFAVAGYDLCTGLGTPTGTNLINDLARAGSCNMTLSGTLTNQRAYFTATLLPNGLVLVAGGVNSNGILSSAELYQPTNGTWTSTGSLSTPRYAHTATLLPNGLVLVAGGYNNSGAVSTAELYNPSTGRWTNTDSLHTARYDHTATLLPNGLVLAAAGCGTGGSYLSSGEVYNPSSGSWATTNGLNTARAGHTATLLPNGLVLVAGGYGTATAELYNPSSNTWTYTGSLINGRFWHSATLLPNGLVIAAGGEGSNSVTLSSAELYNWTNGTWTLTGSLNQARMYHTATLLPNGVVLAAGGFIPSLGSLASAEEYDPALGEWTWTCSLNNTRYAQTATLLPQGAVLFAGGVVGTGDSSNSLASSELFPAPPEDKDFASPSWMSQGVCAHTTTLLPSGLVLVAGGLAPTGSVTNANLYNAASNAWTSTYGLNTARNFHTATLLPNDLVLVAGGVETNSSGSTVLSSGELFYPSTVTWSNTGPLNTARQNHTATLLPDGLVLCAGGLGESGAPLASAELYYPSSGGWTNTGSLNTARTLHTATLLPNGLVLVAGGLAAGGVTASSELYNPYSNSWTYTSGTLNTARMWHKAVLLPNGMVLVAGGLNSSRLPAPYAELYNPSTQTWTNTGALNEPRAYHTATLLPTGQVELLGGYPDAADQSEFYNPSSGLWTTNGSYLFVEYYHTATLLPSGFVLIVGGENNSTNLQGSFDCSSNAFLFTP